MVTLTDREEAICKKLVDSGHADISVSMREHYVSQHELFDELKGVDVDTFYGPAVPMTVRNAMRKAIGKGDRALVSSLHSLCRSFGRAVQ